MLTDIEVLRTRLVGAAPLFRQMADDIHLVPLINQMVRWDDRQTRLSPGERILVLVLDVLSGKTPLYRLTTAARACAQPTKAGVSQSTISIME